ncbi:MAG: O-antigen ligase family protein [Victivallales bacterium]|nr:O-antigen ligase family protein [Victivallales bacterium]
MNTLFQPRQWSRETWLAILLAIVATNNTFWFTFNFGITYYLSFAIVLIVLIFQNNKVVLSVGGLLFWLAGALSIISNEYHAFFNPWGRLAIFLAVGSAIGPYLRNRPLMRMRASLFWIMISLSTILTVLSMFGHFLGFSKVFEKNSYLCGLFSHPNLFSNIAGLGMLFSCWYILANLPNLNRLGKGKFFLFMVPVICFGMLVGTASRTAVVAALAGLTILGFLYMQQFNMAKMMRILCGLVVVLVISSPYWGPRLNILRKKNAGTLTELDTQSRARYWEIGWNGFKASPWTGNGFCVLSDEMIQAGMNFSNKGGIESGNSWISILFMMGLPGAIAMLIIVQNGLHGLWLLWKKDKNISMLLTTLCAYISLHMFGEGYILSAGSYHFLMAWLLLGTVQAYQYETANLLPRPFHSVPPTSQNPTMPGVF